MLVREAKLLTGLKEQYKALDEAIRTAQFIRNKCVRYWMDNRGVGKPSLYVHSKDLAKEFDFAKKLNSTARQASAERAWSSISSFYSRCRKSDKKKGYPQFKKHCRSVEYKQSGWKLSDDCLQITFTDGFKAGTFSVFCNGETREDLHRLKINRVRVVRRADGYYAQFLFDADRKEEGDFTGNVIGLDLGLKYFYKDQNDNAVEYPKFLRKAEKRLKRQQRRLSKRFVKGAKPQSNNYHKARKRLGKCHLKVQRQRKDWAVKLARRVVASNDVVVYEDLKIQNMVKNHHLAKSISDASWYQFTQWLDYFGKIWDKAVVSVSPNFTSQDCSNCGFRVKKTLSTRTHKCPKCHTEICRDTNAALNILKKGMSILGSEYQQYSTQGHWETASNEETLGETSASVNEEKSELISGVTEPGINCS
ncbi:RNA-guided endonuclease InsQ/TnpB family protein [Limnoraphis robusta]|uniref:RNA-guided endonuclease InsQ/TnpB family protein n=1 Tax=Limnoraphis robusta TaxID=1118279 RepID=UPI002B1EBEA0|nr:transposase [Limnoraphis robusta]MEA5498733.1 transposase [Limnoraphis robusta BA-68 BA1]